MSSTPTVSELAGLGRLAFGLRKFAAKPLTWEECDRIVQRRMETRAERLLQVFEQSVFSQPKSPYSRLMAAAGVEQGDVRRLIVGEGVEGALAELARAGVRLSWEEFKGRQPLRRGGRELRFEDRDFDNPAATTYLVGSSSGTSGRRTRTKVDLEFIAESAPNWGVWFADSGWTGRPLVFWTPTHTGLANRYLLCAKLGVRYQRWFALADMRDPFDRLRSGAVHRLCQALLGLRRAEAADLKNPVVVMAYLAAEAAAGRPPLVNTSPSAAAAISSLAVETERSLQGVCFLLGAEPVTPERRRAIEAAGALCRPTYGTSESGWIGAYFEGDVEHDQVRVFRDSYAVLGSEDSNGGPQPLQFTSLLRTSPKALINVELGDSAYLERVGGPAAERWGYDLALHTIRSFRKITCFGVSLAVADLYPILEEFLPQQFGGRAGDYQLLENQSRNGVSGLELRVAPAVGSVSETEIIQALLSEIASKRTYYQPMAAMIEASNGIRVEREEPSRTAAGKVLPVLPATSRES